MSTSFKIFLLVALSFLSSFNLSAHDAFFSIEKCSARVFELANSVHDLVEITSSLAWKSIDDGIPSFRTYAPNDYLTCLKKMSQYEKGIGGSGNVKYYRVQADGQILVGRKHSWLSQGEGVLAAGELKYNNGKIVEISNASGHYLPSIDEASNFLRIFRQAGVKVDDATLTIFKSDGTIFKQVSPTAGDRLTYY